MHVAFTILERSLILEAESLQRVQETLQASFPSRTAPRCAQRQIKLAVFNVQRQRIIRVLLEWGKLMWRFSPDDKASWATAFSVFIMIILAIDKTLTSAYYFCEGTINLGHSTGKTEQAAFKQLVTLTQRELFERCKEIFHRKFRTRKHGTEVCNPIRDGVAAFGRRATEQRTVELVEDLLLLAKDFGTCSPEKYGHRTINLTTPEPEIRAHRAQPPRDSDTELMEYTDAGRLACIFLDDFLDH